MYFLVFFSAICLMLLQYQVIQTARAGRGKSQISLLVFAKAFRGQLFSLAKMQLRNAPGFLVPGELCGSHFRELRELFSEINHHHTLTANIHLQPRALNGHELIFIINTRSNFASNRWNVNGECWPAEISLILIRTTVGALALRANTKIKCHPAEK